MPKVIRSVVLKNVEFWNGKTFEHRDAVYLGNSGNFLSPEIAKQTNFDAEIDCYNEIKPSVCFLPVSDYNCYHRVSGYRKSTNHIITKLDIDELI